MTTISDAVPRHEPQPAARAEVASAREYRSLMSCFPTGVAVVTALDGRRLTHGMTCTSLASVTLAPPTLLVCLRIDSGTLAALTSRGSFGVNLLHARARHVAEIFSSPTPDRFGQVTWEPSPLVRVPWLTEDAFALAECRVRGTTVVGDHSIVLGEVVNTVRRAQDPLLYGMRRFGAWES
jgi:flavin reductase (NADH)